MSGYRRIEPQFCRGCGVTWSPGADACASCGEVIARAPVSSGDPRAVEKLIAVLVCAGVMLAARWTATLSVTLENRPEVTSALTGGLALLALASARAWYPGGLPRALWKLPRPSMWLWALGLAVAVPTIFALLLPTMPDGLPVLTTEVMLSIGGFAAGWVVLAWVAVAFEQAFYFGVLFDGVEAIGGKRNAVIASTLLVAVTFVEPLSALFGLLAAVLRARSGSVAAAIVMRVLASAVWLAWCMPS